MKKLLFVFALSTLVFAYGCSKKTVDKPTDTMSGTVETGTVIDTSTGSTWEIVDETANETTDVAIDSDIKGKYTFEDPNCQKYVSLMECLVEKTPEEGKASTISAFAKVMDLWNSLNVDQLPSVCQQSMDALASQSDVFANAGCPLDNLPN